MDETAATLLEQEQKLYLTGKYKEAIKLAKQHLATAPDNLDILRLLSACYYNLKDIDSAVKITEKIISLESSPEEGLFNLSHLYCLLKQYDKAEEVCLKGLTNNPKHPLGLKNLSSVYINLNKKEQAKKILNLLISDYPQHASAEDFLHLANLLSQETELVRIIHLILLALKREPNHIAGLNYLLSSAIKHNEHYLVIQAIEKLLKIDISKFTKETALNFAIGLFDMGYLHESISMFEYALHLQDDDRARASYGMALFSIGQYEKGWREYQARLALPEVGYQKHQLESKLWRGENLNKKTLLVIHEQGLGDTLQIARFVNLLKKKYKVKIIFKSQIALAKIIEKIAGVDEVITKQDSIPPHHYHIPILSVPYYLRIHSREQLMPEPYITVDQEIISKWQYLISSKNKIKVGFCWNGSKTHVMNARRNCHLKYFLFLGEMKQVQLVSLQKEVTEEEKATLAQHNIIDAGSIVNDLEDTAAIIAQLDLVICIDTSVAHLAGAMGKPVWLLLPFQTEWRHPRGIAKSPWYKDVSFIRQPTIGDWPAVFNQVIKNLQAYIQLNF